MATPAAALYTGGIEAVSLTKPNPFLETKFILTKNHLFIKRCRDADEKVIRMTKCVLSSHSVLPTNSWDLTPRAKQSALLLLFPQGFR